MIKTKEKQTVRTIIHVSKPPSSGSATPFSDTLIPRIINVPVLSSIIASSISAFNCKLVTVASVLLNITSESASILPDENELNTTLINPGVVL